MSNPYCSSTLGLYRISSQQNRGVYVWPIAGQRFGPRPRSYELLADTPTPETRESISAACSAAAKLPAAALKRLLTLR